MAPTATSTSTTSSRTSSTGQGADSCSTSRTTFSVTITLPAGTEAFYFYAEPCVWTSHTITASIPGLVSSGAVSVTGKAGAKYFGFYATGDVSLSAITVRSSYTFAIGEFGISGSQQ